MNRLLCVLLFFSGLFSHAGKETHYRIFSFQALERGKYSVMCMDGKVEEVDYQALRKGHACGKAAPTLPEGPIRGGLRHDSSYQVKCSDGSIEWISLFDFQKGNACFHVGRQILGAPGGLSSQSSTSWGADAIFFSSFSLQKATSLIGFGLYGSAHRTPQVVMGIYTSKDGKPHDLVVQTRPFDIVGPDRFLVGIDKTKLKKGHYFVAFQANDRLKIGTNKDKKAKTTYWYYSRPYTAKLPGSFREAEFHELTSRPASFFAVGQN